MSKSSSLVLNSGSLVLFEVVILVKLISLLSAYVFFKKSVIPGISISLPKFSCFNIAAKFSDVNPLNSWVVIHLSSSVLI